MADYVKIARQVLAITCTLSDPIESEDSAPTESAEIAPKPTPKELAHASAVLAKAGIRLMRIDGMDVVGIWSDLDGPEARAALRTYGSGQLPVRYL